MRDAARRLFALLVAAVLLTAVAVSGRSYFWCVPMHRAMASCCHETAASEDRAAAPVDEPAAPALRGTCCDARAFGALPIASSGAHAPDLPHAVAVAWSLPPRLGPGAAARIAVRSADAPRPRLGRVRAGPPPTAADTCVRLQVFRC